MESELSKAFLVLFVGMLTVFVILSLVVLSGKLLIYIINRFVPADPVPIKKVQVPDSLPVISNNIQPKKLAAIVAAVDAVTGGKGKITKVEKVS